MGAFFRVSSTANRASIRAHGLDWTRLGAALGVAGSPVPEPDGAFLCRDEQEARFLVGINATGGAVDVWPVAGIDRRPLLEAGSGFATCRPGFGPARSPSSNCPRRSRPAGNHANAPATWPAAVRPR